MKVLFFKVDEEPVIVETDGDLKSMQTLVGEYIEVLAFCDYSNDEGLVLICNDEGVIHNFPFNAEILQSSGDTLTAIFGDFFICRSFEDELVGIEDDDIPIAMQYIKR